MINIVQSLDISSAKTALTDDSGRPVVRDARRVRCSNEWTYIPKKLYAHWISCARIASRWFVKAI